ncbi:MAG: hypothetical protein ACE5JR_05455 [Gemmatimonadota bacterium]
MNMTCDEAREVLWPLDQPRGFEPREEEARVHLAGCVSCRHFFERDALLTRALRSVSLSVQAPPEFRERLYDALARERTIIASGEGARPGRSLSRRFPASSRVAAAAAVALLAGAAFWLRAGADGRLGAAKYADDYVRMAVQEVAVPASLDSGTLATFYMRELGRRIVPVRLADAEVKRAIICQIDGRRGAMIEYDLAGSRLAHYRLPMSRGRDGERTDLEVTSEMGVQVARWSDGEYEHALVSEMAQTALTDLALVSFASR